MMIQKVFFVALVSAAVGLGTAAAQERQPSDPCAEATTTVEMLGCLQQRYQKADAELNRVYKELMSRLPERRQAKLREAQRAWIVFRDKSAEFEASAEEGGSMAPLVRLLVSAERTKRRVDELKELLSRKGR